MAIAEIPFSQLGSAVLERQYTGFATAQEFAVPPLRLVTEPVGTQLHFVGASGYATSESGDWSVSALQWEQVLRGFGCSRE